MLHPSLNPSPLTQSENSKWTPYHWLTAVTIESAWRAGVHYVEIADRGMQYKIEFNRSGVSLTQ